MSLLRAKYYSIRTEDVYLGWMRRFILFHGKRHPREMGGAGVAPARGLVRPLVGFWLAHPGARDVAALTLRSTIFRFASWWRFGTGAGS